MRLRLQHLSSWVASGRPPSVAQTKIALQSVCYLHRGPAPFTGHVLQWIKSTHVIAGNNTSTFWLSSSHVLFGSVLPFLATARTFPASGSLQLSQAELSQSSHLLEKQWKTSSLCPRFQLVSCRSSAFTSQDQTSTFHLLVIRTFTVFFNHFKHEVPLLVCNHGVKPSLTLLLVCSAHIA